MGSDPTPAVTTMTEVVTEGIELLWDEIGEVLDFIVAEPVLLIPIGVFIIGAAIGLVSRLLRG